MRKPLWTYLACCIAVFMISMDNRIVTNALPVIREALLTGAALGDRFGRRRLMAIGITVFTAASAASALAPVSAR